MIFKENDLKKPANEDISHFNSFCLSMISGIDVKGKCLDAIFATIDTPDLKHIAQDPHFDRITNLKFMLCLNDLSYAFGAFCLSPGIHFWTKENFGPRNRRDPHSAAGHLEKSRNRPLLVVRRLKPIEEKLEQS